MREIQYYIDHSRSMEVAGYGRDKKCFRFPADDVALLEHEPVGLREIITLRVDALAKLIEKERNIRNGEVKTLDFKVIDNCRIYVLQGLAKGQTVFVPSTEAVKLVEQGLRGKRELARRNLRKSDILAGAQQKHYDGFFLDVREMLGRGIDIDFNRVENFFYDETVGFTAVDRDVNSPINILKDWQWQDIVKKDVFNIFTNFTAVKGDERAFEQGPLGVFEANRYKENRITIAKRVADAMMRGGIPRENVEDFLKSKETASFLTSAYKAVGSKPKARCI